MRRKIEMSLQERNRRIMSNLKEQVKKINMSVFDSKHEAIKNAEAQYVLLQGNLKNHEKETKEELLQYVCVEDDPVSFVWFLAVGASLQLKGVKKREYEEWVDKQHPNLKPYLLGLPPSQYKEEPSGCYITTATCNTLQKGDDCYELEKFRWFRDNWLSKQEGGVELIQHYYNIAPNIVANINLQPDKQRIYTDIWYRYLQPCLAHIEAGNFEACRDSYIKMVNTLQDRFA